MVEIINAYVYRMAKFTGQRTDGQVIPVTAAVGRK